MKARQHKRRLHFFGLPVMETLDDFSMISHISKKKLYFYSSDLSKHYLTFRLPKKNGGTREISQPSRKLKAIQSWILRNILDKLQVSSASKGFKKGDSIEKNARSHIGANSILTIDLENFFPSIDKKRVYLIFRDIGYNKHISMVLTNLCTYKNSLPQGSPCSPYLANLTCIKLDNRLSGFTGKHGIVYTRYSDDMSFSATNSQKLVKSLPILRQIIKDETFNINENKLRLFGPGKRKTVTGLVVIENRVGIGRKKYREIKSRIFNLGKITSEQLNQNEISSIKGVLAFVYSVDKNRFIKLQALVKSLSKRYPNSPIKLIYDN